MAIPQVVYQPFPAATQQPPPQTTIREYRDAFQRDRDMAAMAACGWVATQTTVIPGGYDGTKGCLLAIIFLPLALLAGNQPDRYMVTYTWTGTAAPLVPPQFGLDSPGFRGPVTTQG